ncbi:IS5 family transposase [Candidatus Micrarchaeota archaeon]|nr:IS5 family transposase [Candidatus Micrarchaeota archaeon]
MVDAASGKRWGKKFVDKRDWPEYNGQLVKRGEYLLDLDWVEQWDEELERMNAGKAGARFEFPNSLIELQAVWHAKQLVFRMIEGITVKLCEIGKLPAYNDYSTVNRRVNALNLKLALPTGDDLIVFSDGTGLQAKAGGEYLREKYGKKNRRWVQIIILGDPVTKEPVSFEVNIIQGSEPDSTQQQLERLDEEGVDIAGVGGDGAMDALDLWDLLDKMKWAPVIKTQVNARDDLNNELRNKEVKERNKLGYKRWAKKREYGRRWPATEGIFSAFKRMFGEELHSTSIPGMLQEAGLKVWAYQKIKRYGEAA